MPAVPEKWAAVQSPGNERLGPMLQASGAGGCGTPPSSAIYAAAIGGFEDGAAGDRGCGAGVVGRPNRRGLRGGVIAKVGECVDSVAGAVSGYLVIGSW